MSGGAEAKTRPEYGTPHGGQTSTDVRREKAVINWSEARRCFISRRTFSINETRPSVTLWSPITASEGYFKVT